MWYREGFLLNTCREKGGHREWGERWRGEQDKGEEGLNNGKAGQWNCSETESLPAATAALPLGQPKEPHRKRLHSSVQNTHDRERTIERRSPPERLHLMTESI